MLHLCSSGKLPVFQHIDVCTGFKYIKANLHSFIMLYTEVYSCQEGGIKYNISVPSHIQSHIQLQESDYVRFCLSEFVDAFPNRLSCNLTAYENFFHSNPPSSTSLPN